MFLNRPCCWCFKVSLNTKGLHGAIWEEVLATHMSQNVKYQKNSSFQEFCWCIRGAKSAKKRGQLGSATPFDKLKIKNEEPFPSLKSKL